MASTNTPDNITLSNNHKNPIISQVDLNNQIYDIHDDNAVHTLSDLAGLGMETAGIFVFKGVVDSKTLLPQTAVTGHVYHVADSGSEFIYTGTKWEEFGEHFVVDHTHSIPALTGTAQAQTWTQNKNESFVENIVGANSSSNVSGSGEVEIPTISESAKYAKVSTGNDTFVKSYPGATSKLVTTSITGVSGSTTASKASAGEAKNIAYAGAAVSIPNVATNSSATATNTVFGTNTSASKITASDVTASKLTSAGSVTPGTSPTWSASVNNGVLAFSFGAGKQTTVTLPTFEEVYPSKITANTSVTVPVVKSNDSVTATNTTLGEAISITPAVDNGSIVPYTFEDVSVPKAAGTATTVATGGLAANGGGSSVMTGLGTASTAKALTSASLVAGTSSDGSIHTGDVVTIGSEPIEIEIAGTAEAQNWNFTSGTVVVKGTNSSSTVSVATNTTGTPNA